ncbi:MAG TPA: sulfatase [Myxococcota bacterium]|nr:sulfatase [Myxococcota bacterium]
MWLLLACTPAPPPPPPPASDLGVLDMGSTSTTAWRALGSLAEGSYEFPADSLPPEGPAPHSFALAGPWLPGPRLAGFGTWSVLLPFPYDAPRPNYAPYGAKLFVGDQEIPYVNDAQDAQNGGWLLDHGRIRVLATTEPTGDNWYLEVPELVALERRLNLKLSGLQPAEFALGEISLGKRTRQAVHLPAPASATWQVQVPEKGRLDFGYAMYTPPSGGVGSDGATLRVEVAGEKIWEGEVKPAEDFKDVRLSLEHWAGKTVTLRFRTSPGASTVRDHVMLTAPTVFSGKATPRHILLVGIDTLRYDALSMNGASNPTSPALDAWATNAVSFDRAYAPAPRTRPSFRTALTGRYPLQSVHSPVVAQTLQKQGFRTAGFAANVHLVPRFGFNSGFEEWVYENGARAEDQLSRAEAWIKAHAEEDTFTFVHLMDPHTFYDAPGAYKDRFVSTPRPAGLNELFNRWEVVQRMNTGRMDEAARGWIKGRYDGEVAYMSDQLAAFLNRQDERNANTLTVLISDHGEEFWDHDGYEHNHSLYDELVHVLLMVRPPKGWGAGPHRYKEPVGLIDVVPTLLDIVGVPEAQRGTLDGTSLRPFFDAGLSAQIPDLAGRLAERPLVQGHLMFDTERWSVVHKGWKYILHTLSGREELYNLGEDPKEKRNRAGEAELLGPAREALERGTGWPVRPALRMRMQGSAPFTLQFEAPIREAKVIDPEAGRQIRANLEWGERPLLLPEQVATLAISEDGRGVTVTPGPNMSGQTLVVACAIPADRPDAPLWGCPAGQIVGPQGAFPLRGTITLPNLAVEVSPGTWLSQQFTEAEALSGSVEHSQIEALKALGYLGED